MGSEEADISSTDERQFLEVFGITAASLFHMLNGSLGLIPALLRAAKTHLDDYDMLVSDLDRIEQLVNSSIESVRGLEPYNNFRAGLHIETVTVNSVVRHVYEEKTRAAGRQAASILQLDLAAVLPGVKANERQLTVVVSNLVDNALRAAKRVDVPLVVVKTSCEEDQIAIDVIDNGNGIPPGVIPYLFKRSVREQESHGLGLGLLISQQLMHFWEGKLIVTKSSSSGTTVRAILKARA